jgi:antitoxin (DNA-binding transcriptional repressor) of toxin-antitoxin stability system
LVALASQGEEVVITVEGRAVAKLTGLPQPAAPSKQAWLADLAELRRRGATGKTGGPTVEEILAEDREDRF